MTIPSVISRRKLLTASTLPAAVLAGRSASASPWEKVTEFRQRPQIKERIEAGHRAILDELKPTRQQIKRGLDLHYSSFVADAQGGVPVVTSTGTSGDRMDSETAKVREQLKAMASSPSDATARSTRRGNPARWTGPTDLT